MGFLCLSFEVEDLSLLHISGDLLQKSLGTQVKHSTAFQPQTYGQAECTIQIREDILRACVIDFRGN